MKKIKILGIYSETRVLEKYLYPELRFQGNTCKTANPSQKENLIEKKNVLIKCFL